MGVYTCFSMQNIVRIFSELPHPPSGPDQSSNPSYTTASAPPLLKSYLRPCTGTSSDHSETSWLREIALSLLPSFPLSALGWYYKRRSQKITNKSVKDETMQQVYEEQQNTKMTGKSGEEVLPLKCLFYIYNSICLKSIDI